ncbi:MAG: hypothetical protein LBJ04_08460 [Sphingobacterium sp.]|nr:hypothetical protein [Sphingobacterium sp.]
MKLKETLPSVGDRFKRSHDWIRLKVENKPAIIVFLLRGDGKVDRTALLGKPIYIARASRTSPRFFYSIWRHG